MFDNMENLKVLNVIRGPSSLRQPYRNRASHALVFKCSSASHYTFPNAEITLNTGDVLFLPQGSSYTVSRVSGAYSEYILINFQASIPDARPALFTPTGTVDWVHKLEQARLISTPADRHRLYAIFYELLAAISAADTAYRSSGDLKRLAPAEDYLKKHLFDPELKVSTLHTLCGISDTYFRKLFICAHGLSPKKYILLHRLQQARAILENGEFNDIREVAQLSGFEDALYFSKVFKKQYGYPPSLSG